MSDIKLGQIIEGEAQRDAIHVAVAPVVAAHTVYPAEHVGFLGDGFVGRVEKPIGIVDPFLKEPVGRGQKFYLLLYQNTITGMRHEWQHPAFVVAKQPDPVEKPAESRLREIAAACDMGYDMMMEAAHMWLEYEDYAVQQGQETWRDLFPAFTDEFWVLYEKVKGVIVPQDKRESFFSCSC